MRLRGKKVLVLGLGRSGEAATELLLKQGARVSVLDDGSSPDLKKRARRLLKRGVAVDIGVDRAVAGDGFELLVLSPGIAPSHRRVRWAEENKVPVIGEVELAYHFLACPLIAVTGTNGKSTTVALIAEMLKEQGINCALGGNIGIPLSRAALRRDRPSLVVAEISSFQLERIRDFRPDTAVFLNLSPDHLDRHPNLKTYREAKLRIFRNQKKGARAVLPAQAPSWLEEGVPPCVGKFYWGAGGIVFRQGQWLEARPVRTAPPRRLCQVKRVTLPGSHNLQNLMAASAVALLHGAAPDAIRQVAETFRGLPHRLEYVLSRRGIRFYNDSKATNPAAAKVALRSFDRPVVWIAGGSDKGLKFSDLPAVARRSVKLAIFMGETRRKLQKAFEGKIPCRVVADLSRAVSLAYEKAAPGDAVLLSPGCASFDMFNDYEERGEAFKSLVNALRVEVAAQDLPFDGS